MTQLEITGKQILDELDLPAYANIPFIVCSKTYFSKAFSRLVDYYAGVSTGTTSGPANFAIRFLLARCINDLVTGYHLATHGYIIQFYSVMRGILESLDKVSLFSKEEKYGRLWVNEPDRARKELSPSKVRQLLGMNSYDKIYSHFCEMGSHPTFPSSRTMVYGKKQPGKNIKIIVRVGPTDLVYPILFSLGLSFLMMMFVSLSSTKHLGRKIPGQDGSFLKAQFIEMDNFIRNCMASALKQYEEKPSPDFQELLDFVAKQKKILGIA